MMLLFMQGSVYGQNVLSLEQVFRNIDLNNPELKVYESTVRSKEAKVSGARAWMAPMLGGGTYMTPYPGSQPMDNSNKGAWMITAEQDIPNPGKIKARATYLSADADVSRLGRTVAYNELRFQARQLYMDLLIDFKKIGIQKENLEIMRYMKKLAKVRYPYNQAGLNQIFKAEGREYESDNMLLMTQGDIKSKKIALNALMSQDPDTDFLPDTTFNVEFSPVAKVDTGYLASRRSDIRQMDRSIRAMELNVNQMRKEAKPDFRLRFDHMSNYSGMMPAQYTLMGMISIPIAPWSSGMYKSQVKAMNFEVQAMQQQKVAMLNQMQGMTRSMENELLTMQSQLRNYERKIIPSLSKNLSVSLLAFQENKLDLNNVIDAWEAKNMAQMNYLEQLQKFYQMIASYERNIER